MTEVSRIQKIVERSKAKTGHNEEGSIRDANTATRRAAHQAVEYTTTRVVEVAKDALEAKRIVTTDSANVHSSQFQVLRTKVLQQMRKSGWTTLGISAPSAGAGKSLVAVNLAVSMAVEGNQSVLLVDMDLRKPAIHDYFGFSPEWGVHDIVEGNATVAETLVNPGIERLVVLPGRKALLNSSVTMASPDMRLLVEELKRRYSNRVVIFDLPPALMSDDVLVFLPYMDCGLCVVESGATNRNELESAIDVMGARPLLGTVLNKIQIVSSGPYDYKKTTL